MLIANYLIIFSNKNIFFEFTLMNLTTTYNKLKVFTYNIVICKVSRFFL